MRDVPERLEEEAVIEPADPFGCCVFDGLETAPRASTVNDLSFEQAVGRLGECVDAPMFVKRQKPGPVRRRGHGLMSICARAVSGRDRDNAPWALDMAENMGCAGRPPSQCQTRDSRFG